MSPPWLCLIPTTYPQVLQVPFFLPSSKNSQMVFCASTAPLLLLPPVGAACVLSRLPVLALLSSPPPPSTLPCPTPSAFPSFIDRLLFPPPPPLPPNMPLHSLGILQKRMIVESTMNTENTRPNISSLSTKHRSMDSLVTAKIATPETLDYMSPPITPTRRNSPHNKMHRNLRNNENHPSSNIYGVTERYNSPVNPPQGLGKVGINRHYAQDENSSKNDIESNFSRRDAQRYQPQNKKRDGRDMRRSISHNSLAMRNRNQNQLHQHLSQQNSFNSPFQINPSNSSDLQSNHRKYHPQSQHYPHPRYQEKHHGDGSKHGSHIMTSSYPSDGGTTATLGPMSMFGDFSIDPKKKNLRTQMSHPEISRGMQ